MLLGRIVLILTGASFAGYGVACLLNPELPAGYIGIELSGVSGTVEVVAMYGGLQGAFGLLCFYLAAAPERVRSGLILVLVICGGLAFGRGFGLLVHGTSSYNLGALAYEMTTTALAGLSVRRLGSGV
mgnify:FL=1